MLLGSPVSKISTKTRASAFRSRMNWLLALFLIFVTTGDAISQVVPFAFRRIMPRKNYWTGGGGNANWSTGGNWSIGTAPLSTDIAIFDGTCSSNCSPTMDGNVTLNGILMDTGYTGTINQNTRTISLPTTVSLPSSGFIQKAGTFNGGSGNITVAGQVFLYGGTFTSTSGNFTINPSLTVSGVGMYMDPTVTFSHNNGKITVSNMLQNCTSTTNTYDFPDGTTLYDLATAFPSGCGAIVTVDINSGKTLYVTRSFTNGSGYGKTDGGTIYLTGTASYSDTCTACKGGTANFVFTGSSNQTYAGSNSISLYWGPSITVDKSGGTLTPSSNNAIAVNNFTLTQGTITSPTGNVAIRGNATFTSGTYTATSGTTTVYGSWSVATGGSAPTFNANGGTITFAPSSTSVTINPGGATYNVLSFTPSTATTTFTNAIAGAASATFAGTGNVTYDLGGFTHAINGPLTISTTTSGTRLMNNGSLNVTGAVTTSNNGLFGTGWVRLTGSSNQLVTNSGTPSSGTSSLPSFEIASTGGTVSFSGTPVIGGSFKYTSGTVSFGTTPLQFSAQGNTSVTVTPGAFTYSDVTFVQANGSGTVYDLGGNTMNMTGTLTMNLLSLSAVQNGTLSTSGNLDVTGIYSGGTLTSATIQLVGSSSTTIGPYAPGGASNIVVNKSGGATVTQTGAVSINGAGAQTLTLTAGNWLMSGFALTIKNNPSLNGNTLTKGGGTLKVNSATIGTGSLYGGTVAP